MAKRTGFKLLKEKEILTSRVYSVKAQLWRKPDGALLKRQTVWHPGAVAILALDKKRNVLLIKQFRPAAQDFLLEVPAGTLEKGEQPLACAKRELIEETGFAARKWKKLGAVFTAPGFCTERIHLFKAWDLYPAYADPDEDEEIDVVVMPLKKVLAAARSGKIIDAKTLSALLLNS